MQRFALLVLLCAVVVACGDSAGPSEVESAPVSLVETRRDATCALTTDGRVFCWGVPIGAVACADDCLEAPAVVAHATTFDSLVIGGSGFQEAACSLTPDGTPHCWGMLLVNLDGGHSLGAAPTQLENALTLRSIDVGLGHICGIAPAGDAWCWGDYDGARRGQETPSPGGVGTDFVPNAVRGDHEFVALQTGDWNTCGLDAEGQVWCWGAGHMLGNTTAPLITDDDLCGYGGSCSFDPVPIEGNHEIVAFADRSGCAITAADALVCWDASRASPPRAPETVPLPVGVTQFVTGSAHQCVLAADGAAWCWGDNTDGQLGIGSAASSTVPARVRGNLTFRELAAGSTHTCGVTTDMALYCWGDNGSGQLGTGSRETARVPVHVLVDPA